MSYHIFDFVVVGAGVFGISTALFLALHYPNQKIALIEQFQLGHTEGSSHSQSRIIRSTYQHQFYRDLCLEGINIYWPEVQKVLNGKFIIPNYCVSFIEPDDLFKQFERVALSSKDQLKIMSMEQMRKLLPSAPYVASDKPVFVDTKAGVVMAQNYLKSAVDFLRKCQNVTIYEQSKLVKLTNSIEKVELKIEKNNTVIDLRAKKVSLSCGRWINRLVPQLLDLTKEVRQTVSYWEMKNPQNYKIGKFPCWIHYDKKGENRYGLPDVTGIGIKFAFHETNHLLQKSFETEKEYIKQQIRKYERDTKSYFGDNLVKLTKIEKCYYTVIKSEDFLIDWKDNHQNVLIVSSCSGHGFKFGPVVGKIVADLLVKNQSIDIFQKYRYLTRLYYHLGVNLQ